MQWSSPSQSHVNLFAVSLERHFILQLHWNSQIRTLLEQGAQHGHDNLSITVDAYVSLNGRSSQRLIQADVDLTQEASSLHGKDWITRP